MSEDRNIRGKIHPPHVRAGFQGVLGKIYKFNKDRGLLDNGFDYNREATFLMSESLELIDHKELSFDLAYGEDNQDDTAKMIISDYGIDCPSDLDKAVKFVDTFIDQFVFGSGGCMKMGLTLGTIEYLIHIVADANLQKTGGVDAEGKFSKGTAFKAPDEAIREVLMQLPQFKEGK